MSVVAGRHQPNAYRHPMPNQSAAIGDWPTALGSRLSAMIAFRVAIGSSGHDSNKIAIGRLVLCRINANISIERGRTPALGPEARPSIP